MSRAYIWEGDFHSGHLHPECWDALCRSEGTEEGFETGAQKRGQAYDHFGDPIGLLVSPATQGVNP